MRPAQDTSQQNEMKGGITNFWPSLYIGNNCLLYSFAIFFGFQFMFFIIYNIIKIKYRDTILFNNLS